MTNRVATLVTVMAVVLGTAATARAQVPLAGPPLFELTGGYQLLRVSADGSNTYPVGVAVDGARYVGPYALVVELGWSRDSTEVLGAGVSASSTVLHFGGGPRYLLVPDGRIRPYLQVLAGFARASFSTTTPGGTSTGSDSAFMVQPGFGVLIVMGPAWGFVGAVDYRRSFYGDDAQNLTSTHEGRGFFGVRLILE
jgi:hypothetical protein